MLADIVVNGLDGEKAPVTVFDPWVMNPTVIDFKSRLLRPWSWAARYNPLIVVTTIRGKEHYMACGLGYVTWPGTTVSQATRDWKYGLVSAAGKRCSAAVAEHLAAAGGTSRASSSDFYKATLGNETPEMMSHLMRTVWSVFSESNPRAEEEEDPWDR